MWMTGIKKDMIAKAKAFDEIYALMYLAQKDGIGDDTIVADILDILTSADEMINPPKKKTRRK